MKRDDKCLDVGPGLRRCVSLPCWLVLSGDKHGSITEEEATAGPREECE